MKSHQYKNYTISEENGIYDVSWKKALPPSVCKYYGDADQNKEALINSFLYCSHPYQFNDSMDSSFYLWDLSKLNEQRFDKIVEHFKFNKKTINLNFIEDKKKSFSKLRWLLFNLASDKFGIVSLTGNGLNDLMWGHYASEKGFMVQFNRKKLLEEDKTKNPKIISSILYPVDYQEKLKKIDILEQLNKSLAFPFINASILKRIEWKYEEEWRLLINSNDGFGVPNTCINNGLKDIPGNIKKHFYYSPDAIEYIILGKYFFNGENSKIEQVFSEKYQLINCVDIRFLNYIYNHFPDHIYICDEKDGEYFERIGVRVEVIRHSFDTFELIRKEEYLKIIE